MADHSFCRMLLSELMGEIKTETTVAQRKESYAFQNSGGYEFHGPDGYCKFLGNKVDCLWSAKAYGWEAWRAHEGRKAVTKLGDAIEKGLNAIEDRANSGIKMSLENKAAFLSGFLSEEGIGVVVVEETR